MKSRISALSWRRRVEQALTDERIIKQVLAAVKSAGSLNAAIAQHLPAARRSWAIRHIPAYRADGFEGLISRRTPREPKISKVCKQAIQAARAANAKVTVERVLEILARQKITPLPSASTIKREFFRVDDRRRYAEKKERSVQEIIDLPFAGGELLLAAESETGGMGALTSTVLQLSEAARRSAKGATPTKNVLHRDRRGRFTVTYNRRRRRKKGEEIASYLKSAQEKAQGRIATWPRFVREKSTTIEAKIRMLVFSWMVATTQGWAALRAPDVAGLEPLTGFAYMPSTLTKFVSALAISNAGPPLLETVGTHWHEVSQKHFREPGSMAAIYIDNHAKEVWSSLFMKSGKVSHLNRVMPCITTTYAHTGAGTPVVLSVQSGSAPLAPRLVNLVEQAEQLLGGSVERAVVVDSECSVFDLLESFAKHKRVLITPLRRSRMRDLELRFSPGSYFRPYRETGELRIGRCTLVHKGTGRTLEIGALVIRREHRKTDTVLLTNGLDLGFEGRELADLYFRRWPVQENAFKEAAVLGLDQHRGNSGRMVANVAVITELDKLTARTRRAQDSLTALRTDSATLMAVADKAAKEDRRAQAALATRRRRLDTLMTSGNTTGTAFARVALEHQEAFICAEKTSTAATKARKAFENNRARIQKIEQQCVETEARQLHLESQRTIRQLDVAQDMILTATKLTAAQLISFALRSYLPVLPMTPETFVSRVFTARGRKEIEPTIERIVFYENPRDPEVTAALNDACQRLNKRGIKREGRRLHYAVETAPE